MVISNTLDDDDVVKILNYETSVISSLWRKSDTDWVDITNYDLYMKDPGIGNIIELTSILQGCSDKNLANIWFRWKLTTSTADGASSTVTYVEDNTLSNITLGLRFRSSFGCQFSNNPESNNTLCNTLFHVVDVSNQGHVFQPAM